MTEENKSKLTAIGITVIICGALTYWGILVIGVYGFALFLLTPLLIGMCPVIIYGRKRQVTTAQARNLGLQTLALFVVSLVVFAFEGLICIAMLSPIALVLTWAGTLVGHSIVMERPNKGMVTIIILTLSIPITAFMEKTEKDDVLPLIEVTTSIEINAAPEDVWNNVIQFPTLNDPAEFIFKTGIAYPVSAEIKGRGVGAMRYCNFSTGRFVEPITSWDEPKLLKFDVLENPAPMKEISFYDIDAPHLHDYFVSKRGQFKLSKLGNGKTLLEGTTWYYHDIKPGFYWELWSNYIIHKIHFRVLNHIKETTERASSENRSSM
jgi:hypothetical protein